ncbi:hypothetical protein GW17_00062132, partial [Ensete ventricosum]
MQVFATFALDHLARRRLPLQVSIDLPVGTASTGALGRKRPTRKVVPISALSRKQHARGTVPTSGPYRDAHPCRGLSSGWSPLQATCLQVAAPSPTGSLPAGAIV